MAFDPWAQFNAANQNLGNTLSDLSQSADRQQVMKRQNALADLQMEQGQATLADTAAKQKGLQTALGVTTLEDAYTKQFQTEQAAAQAKQRAEKQKAVGDVYARMSGLVEKGIVDPGIATKLFHHDLKGLGVDLEAAGMDFSFKGNTGYYSGKVTPETLVMIGGKPTAYGSEGIVKDWKVSSLTPEGVPIFEIPKGGEFKELRVDSEALLDKRLAAQSANIDKQIAAADARAERSAGKGEFRMDDSNRKYAVTLRKEFNNLPEVKESNSIMPKITSMHKALEESQRTKNFVAVDQALITLYNKLTDPSSVVRESEYARTAQNIPLINQIKGKAQKIMTGGAGLTTAEREALVKMADLMAEGYKEIRDTRIKEYNGYAASGGVDPKTVINDDFRMRTGGKTGGARPSLSSIFGK